MGWSFWKPWQQDKPRVSNIHLLCPESVHPQGRGAESLLRPFSVQFYLRGGADREGGSPTMLTSSDSQRLNIQQERN